MALLDVRGLHRNFYGVQALAGVDSINPTFWAGHVIHGRKPYIGYDADDIRSVFLHQANWYGEGDLPLATVFAGLAVTPYLAIR